ncbi:hypothetical protein IWQ60_009643 [Tieghemiomyces parasiticus]|uniref:C2H2-type domain-containing protein n=1 Tax=Tieghemiomyces parasiticus TaxID=78921 RepID=A0A9W7ZX11_9FUNG|nr:hypothetical protein IWQ60_009643 [Tieghemiomyces parasiticus]
MAYSTLTQMPTASTFYFDKEDKAKGHLRTAREPYHVRRPVDVRSQTSSSSPELQSATFNAFTPLRATVVCNVCGKKYKHRSCLTKHLWEHHESWESCLKYNLTKHQQVQMMEAAQILLDMPRIEA